MGRKPTISREGLLAIAEGIVNSEGPQALTIDALAKAAGISKGGVQYSFASKDALIKALIDRWTSQFDAQVVDMETADPSDFVKSYVAAMRNSERLFNAKVASAMINSLQDPANRNELSQWYHSILRKLGKGRKTRAARVAFMAVEGLMLMRMSGVEETDIWDTVLDDLEALLDAE